MTSEKPYMHCRQCGIRYRSDKAAEHDRQCSYNDSQKGPSPSHKTSSSSENGNQIRDTSEYYSQSNVGKKTVTTRTVKEKDGVKEVHETVEYKDESPGGRKEVQEQTSSQSDSSKGGGPLKTRKPEGKQEVSSQNTKLGDDKNAKKDIGNEPYPTEAKLEKEKHEVPEPEEKDPVDEFIQKLPEFDHQAEKAYESHKENLTPCSHCERSFTPDRLAKHERVCGEKSDENVTDKK